MGKAAAASLKLTLALSILFLWGLSFEFSYFSALHLSAWDTLDSEHFVASSAIQIFPMLIVLVLISQIQKFFTSKINKSDQETIAEALSATTFEKQIKIARVSITVSTFFFIFVFVASTLGFSLSGWAAFLLVAFFNLQSFYGAISLSPSHARPTVVLMFVLSISLCFAAGGYGLATNSLDRPGAIRDDFIVKIEKTGTGIHAESKNLHFKIPQLSIVLKNKISG